MDAQLRRLLDDDQSSGGLVMARKVGVGKVRPRDQRTADGELDAVTKRQAMRVIKRVDYDIWERRARSREVSRVVSGLCFIAILVIVAIAYSVQQWRSL